MKILVTGGAGFIGSTVADAYVAAGHRVWSIDNESSGSRKNVHPRVRYTKMDVRNKNALNALFKRNRFDVVNHHAAQIDVRRSVENPQFDADVNLIGILNVLTAARKFKTKKVIFASSGGTVYGECAKPATESFPEVPLSPYGVAKLASEKYIKAFSAMYGLSYTIFRYANVYGPRQDPHGEAGVVAIFSKLLLDEKVATIYGDGKQTRDFVFVRDVARANAMAATRAKNEIINIGTGREISVNDLYRTMASIVHFRKPPVRKPARIGELRRSVLRIGHAKKVLNWSPAYSLREGLAQTIDFFR